MRRKPVVRVGHWYALCCVHDLTRINDDRDLSDVKSMVKQFSGYTIVWPTLRAALDDLLDPKKFDGLEDAYEDWKFARKKWPHTFLKRMC